MWVLLVEVQLNARVDFASGTGRRRACEPGMHYFSISSPTMWRSQPKYIEGVGRKVGVFLIRAQLCGVVNWSMHDFCCTEFARMSFLDGFTAKRLRTDVRTLYPHHLL